MQNHNGWMLNAIWQVLKPDHIVRTHSFKYHSTLYDVRTWNHPSIPQQWSLSLAHNHVYKCKNCGLFCCAGVDAKRAWFKVRHSLIPEYELHIYNKDIIINRMSISCNQELMLKALK